MGDMYDMAMEEIESSDEFLDWYEDKLFYGWPSDILTAERFALDTFPDHQPVTKVHTIRPAFRINDNEQCARRQEYRYGIRRAV